MVDKHAAQAALHEARRRFLLHRSEDEFNSRKAAWEAKVWEIVGPARHPDYLGWTEFHSNLAVTLAEAIMTVVAEIEAEEAKKVSTKTKAKSGRKKGSSTKSAPADADMEVGSWD